MSLKYYHDIDLTANQLLNSRLHNISTTDRITLGGSLSLVDKGYQVYDTDLLSPFYWNGVAWVTPSGSSESDPLFTAWLSGIPNLSEFNNDVGYLTSYTETDPIYSASSWFSTTNNSTNWNTAFSWGNHNLMGYLTSFTETDPIYSTSTWFSTTNNSSDWNTAFSWGNHASAGYLTTIGSGTINYVPKWSSSSALTDSSIFDNGTSVGIGTATPSATYKLHVVGSIATTSGVNVDPTVSNKTGLYGASNTMTFWAGNNQLATYTLVGNVAGSYFSHTIPFNNSTGSVTQNAWRIASSVIDTGANSIIHNQLLIDPQYQHASFGTGLVRGVYYNPTVTSLNGADHTAWENTSGDIIHANLGGGGNQMVVVDNIGKLGVQSIPTGGSGTVTSVSAGTGMSFTTITTTGSVSIDSAKVPYYSGGFSTGFAKYNGSSWIFDNSTYLTTISGLNISSLTNDSGYITSSALSPYLTSAAAASTYQPLDSDLTAIAALTGTSGFLKTNGAGTWSVDTNTYLTTISGLNISILTNNSGYITSSALSGYLTSAIAASTYEPIFSKNTAFNKNFGTGVTNIVEIGSTLGNTLLIATDSGGKLQTLATSTYPSLTELSYVKGVTSAVQTQFDSGRENHIIRAYTAMGSTIKAQPLGLSMTNIGSAGTIGSTNASRMTLIAVYLETSQTITGIKWYQGTLGSYTANNENRIALYSVSGGTLTLVASCTNDGTLWQTVSSNTFGSKAFSATYAASPGLYYIGLLYSNSASVTAPTIGISGNLVNANVQSGDFANSLGLQLIKNAVVALPSSITASTYTQVQQQYWAAIY